MKNILNNLLNLNHPDDRIALIPSIYNNPISQSEIFQAISGLVLENYNASEELEFFQEAIEYFKDPEDQEIAKIAFILNCAGEGFKKIKKFLKK